MFHQEGNGLDARCVKELRGLLEGFENKREALIPCLNIAQRWQHYVSREAAAFLAKETDTSLAEVYGVATFYHMLSEKPLGKNVIRVCDCLTCHVKGGPAILGALKEELGVEIGGTTKDGKVSLLESPCMGLCDIAPAIMVNDQAFGNLTPKRAKDIAKAVKIGVSRSPAGRKRPGKSGLRSKVIA